VDLVTFQALNFRNLARDRLSFSGGVTLIAGDNAQGKTNLLEAVATLGNLTSFRTRMLSRIVTRGQREFALNGEVRGAYGTVVLEEHVDVGPPLKRRLMISGKIVSPAEYLNVFPVVALTREDSDLVIGSPQGRRSFLDRVTFQIDAQHFDRVVRYRRALAQRNAALVMAATDAEMSAWEAELAGAAATVLTARTTVMAQLSTTFQELYDEIRDPSFPDVTLKYRSDSWLQEGDSRELENQYRERYAVQRQRDRDAGFTLSGPHRHDVVIEAGGRPARDHLSTGQVKLVGAGLRMAALELVESARREKLPVLIDDIDAELDDAAVKRLMVRAGADRQLFVTSARRHPAAFAHVQIARFTMRRGVCEITGEDVHE